MLFNALKLNRRHLYGIRNYSSQSNAQHLQKSLSSDTIRNMFLDYFTAKQNHRFIRSSPVVPHCDATVPFVNAGMNQVDFRLTFIHQFIDNENHGNVSLSIFSSKISFWTMCKHHAEQLLIHRNAFESVVNIMISMLSALTDTITPFSKCWAIGHSAIISKYFKRSN